MATNLNLDTELIEQAVKLGGHATKRSAVNAALAEYVRRHQQMAIFELAGKIEWAPDYDYKQERRRTHTRLKRQGKN